MHCPMMWEEAFVKIFSRALTHRTNSPATHKPLPPPVVRFGSARKNLGTIGDKRGAQKCVFVRELNSATKN